MATQPEDNEWVIIQKAEWCRNLGRFKEAFRLLRQVHEKELIQTKRKVWLAAFLRNRKLLIIHRDNAYYRKPLLQQLKKLFKR